MIPNRGTAIKANIKAITSSAYIHREAPLPNYLSVNGEKALRVNIIGIAVRIAENEVVLDDGTGSLTAKSFTENIPGDKVQLGDTVLLIGKPRAHNQTIYVVAEIIKAIDEDWLQYRRKELRYEDNDSPVVEDLQKPDGEPVNYTSLIIKTIEELDEGNGAPTGDVIEKTGLDDVQKYIELLINEGEIFEIRPGHLKVL